MARVLLGNIKGPKGDTGPTGPAGVAGSQGEPGYTPVKGTDYFTEEDIKNLESHFASATESADYPGCYYRIVDGVQEWINPPMLPDVEYRTTERMNGKPVYTMYISTFGSLPDNAEKKIAMPIDTATVIEIEGYAQSGTAFRSISSIGGDVYVTNEWELGIKTTWYASAYTTHIFLKYLKP